ncbi:GAF domain-containing sensor histidine kinase [Kribbella sancticallisti]|uniref:GAF domain-containing sensor histidine kinase n=1 Tax=Kribbella sancticallisti TaxID=460087 RepID=UPI0031D1F719
MSPSRSPASGAAASYGRLTGEPYRIPLLHQGELVGTLALGTRSPGERFSAADLSVLADVARQAAIATHAARLADDLQSARERLVLAREEERRRLRRDLHDGLGSTLAGMALYAGNARRALTQGALSGEGGDAAQWLDRLEVRATEAVADIRRVVHDLRPPSLDELGLVGAVRSAAGGLALPVAVIADEPLPAMSAAVEVAAYRIAVEALTNTARHAQASRATVRIRADEVLVVEVVDDGRGLGVAGSPGVGLGSMRERAEELGGSLTVTTGAGAGVVVRAELPNRARTQAR